MRQADQASVPAKPVIITRSDAAHDRHIKGQHEPPTIRRAPSG